MDDNNETTSFDDFDNYYKSYLESLKKTEETKDAEPATKTPDPVVSSTVTQPSAPSNTVVPPASAAAQSSPVFAGSTTVSSSPKSVTPTPEPVAVSTSPSIVTPSGFATPSVASTPSQPVQSQPAYGAYTQVLSSNKVEPNALSGALSQSPVNAATSASPNVPNVPNASTSQPTTNVKSAQKSAPGFGYTLLVILITVALTFGVVWGGAKAGFLNFGTSTDVSREYASTQTLKALEKDNENPNWDKVFAVVNPSVVSIQITVSNGTELGSGFILDKEGNIVTNNHVVEDAVKSKNAKISVTLSDGRIYSAQVVGTDDITDLAVIKLENAPTDLSTMEFADSENVVVGDQVLAVGNPLGLANTATTGIVSAIDRPVAASSESTSGTGATSTTNAIQIDAAVNPGNSGGPLFDSAGKVIGVTSSIAQASTTTTGSIGIGFAIPSKVAQLITSEIIADGSVKHPALGISVSSGSTKVGDAEYRTANVAAVGSGSPAELGGMKVGDSIIAVDGKPVISSASLIGFINVYPLASSVKITIVRNGQQQDLTIQLNKERSDAVGTLPSQQQTPYQLPGNDDGNDFFDPFNDGN
jgi:putative serine protease PepD